MLPGNPLIWLSVVLAVALPVTYGVSKIRANAAAVAAYDKGVAAGKGMASTSTVVEATKTADATREAEAETVISPDKKSLLDLCKRRASCRERATLK